MSRLADAEFAASMEEVLATVPASVRRRAPGGVHGRAAGAVGATQTRPSRWRRTADRPRQASIASTNGPWDGSGFPILRTAGGLSGRRCRPRACRTKTDWAREVAGLLEGRYADCGRITLVLDNLNTHTKAGPSMKRSSRPVGARQLVRRHRLLLYAAKHGCRLNIAENELSAAAAHPPNA